MSTKHQPCGKAGCINCWPESKSFNGQAPILNMLNEDEARLREVLLRRSRQMQNCAPGSPLYDKVLGTNIYRTAQQQTNKFYADLADVVQQAPQVDMICAESFKAGQKDAMQRMTKLIPRISIYLVLALGLGALALMVLS